MLSVEILGILLFLHIKKKYLGKIYSIYIKVLTYPKGLNKTLAVALALDM